MKNRYFSIDQSIACTGWCYFESGELIDFGCVKTSKETGSLHERMTNVCSKLVLSAPSDWVRIEFCREGLGFGGSKSNASRDLAYLVGGIELIFGIAFKEVPPTTLKKFATGSGRADKQDMIDALPEDVRTRFLEAGYKKSTGLADLADAYWIGKYFIEKDSYNE